MRRLMSCNPVVLVCCMLCFLTDIVMVLDRLPTFLEYTFILVSWPLKHNANDIYRAPLTMFFLVLQVMIVRDSSLS